MYVLAMARDLVGIGVITRIYSIRSPDGRDLDSRLNSKGFFSLEMLRKLNAVCRSVQSMRWTWIKYM